MRQTMQPSLLITFNHSRSALVAARLVIVGEQIPEDPSSMLVRIEESPRLDPAGFPNEGRYSLGIREGFAVFVLKPGAKVRIVAHGTRDLAKLSGFVFARHVLLLVIDLDQHQRVALAGTSVSSASILAPE